MSSFRRRALEAWRTRGVVTYGPRLSDDPRWPDAARAFRRAAEAEEWRELERLTAERLRNAYGPVTYHGAAVDIAPLPIAEEFNRLPSPWAVPVG